MLLSEPIDSGRVLLLLENSRSHEQQILIKTHKETNLSLKGFIIYFINLGIYDKKIIEFIDIYKKKQIEEKNADQEVKENTSKIV